MTSSVPRVQMLEPCLQRQGASQPEERPHLQGDHVPGVAPHRRQPIGAANGWLGGVTRAPACRKLPHVDSRQPSAEGAGAEVGDQIDLDVGLAVAGADVERPVAALELGRWETAPGPTTAARKPPRWAPRSQWSTRVSAAPASASPRKVTVWIRPAGAPARRLRNCRSSASPSGCAGSAGVSGEARHAETRRQRGLQCRQSGRSIAAPAALVAVGTNGEAVVGSASSPNRSSAERGAVGERGSASARWAGLPS